MAFGFVTTTLLRDPAGSAGVVAVICVGPVTSMFVAGWPPTVTVAPSSKSMPLMVTLVPPAGGPEAGFIEKINRCENSDVFPLGSVAVAEMRDPVSTFAGSVTSIVALPEPSVVDLSRADVVLTLEVLLRARRTEDSSRSRCRTSWMRCCSSTPDDMRPRALAEGWPRTSGSDSSGGRWAPRRRRRRRWVSRPFPLAAEIDPEAVPRKRSRCR